MLTRDRSHKRMAKAPRGPPARPKLLATVPFDKARAEQAWGPPPQRAFPPLSLSLDTSHLVHSVVEDVLDVHTSELLLNFATVAARWDIGRQRYAPD